MLSCPALGVCVFACFPGWNDDTLMIMVVGEDDHEIDTC